MEIVTLQLRITEGDLNAALKRHLPPNQPVEDVQVRLTASGVVVTGVLPLFIQVKFETLWELSIHEGKLQARLAHFKAMGVPANIFKSAVLKLVEDGARRHAWLTLNGDRVAVDIEGLARSVDVTLSANLQAAICLPGEVLVSTKKP